MKNGRRVKLYKVGYRECSFRTCRKKPAPWVPELTVPLRPGASRAFPDQPGEVVFELDLTICDDCLHLPKRAFLSDEGWRILCALAHRNGYVIPLEVKPNNATLQFRSLETGKVVSHGGTSQEGT